MLTFLYLAARHGLQIDGYEDQAIGTVTKNEKGVPWMSRVTLNPRVIYLGGKPPTPAEQEHLHHLAHEQCYIANSVKTEVEVRTSSGA